MSYMVLVALLTHCDVNKSIAHLSVAYSFPSSSIYPYPRNTLLKHKMYKTSMFTAWVKTYLNSSLKSFPSYYFSKSMKVTRESEMLPNPIFLKGQHRGDNLYIYIYRKIYLVFNTISHHPIFFFLVVIIRLIKNIPLEGLRFSLFM